MMQRSLFEEDATPPEPAADAADDPELAGIPTRAIALLQPWLYAVLHFGKDIENRVAWQGSRFRGPVFLHASRGCGTLVDYHGAVMSIVSVAAPRLARADYTTKGTKLSPSEQALLDELLAFVRPFAVQTDVPKERGGFLFGPAPELARGGICGVTTFADVIMPGGVRGAPRGRPSDKSHELHPRRQSPWYMGEFAFVLEKTRTLPFHPFKCLPGFVQVPDAVRRFYRDAFPLPGSEGR